MKHKLEVKHSIRKKLLIINALTILGIVSLLTFAIAYNSANHLENESRKHLAERLDQAQNVFRGFLEVRRSNFQFWLSNPLFKSTIDNPEVVGFVLAHSLRTYLDGIRENEPWLENLLIVQGEDSIIFEYDLVEREEGHAELHIKNLQKLKELPFDQFKVIHYFQDGKEVDLIVYKQFFSDTDSDNKAFFFLNPNIVNHRLFNDFSIGEQGLFSLVINSHEDHIHLPEINYGSLKLEDLEKIISGYYDFNELPQSHKNFLLEHRLFPQSDFAVIGIIPYSELFEIISQMVWTSIFLGAGILLLGIFGTYYFSRRLTIPIRNLALSIQSIREGNWEVRIDEEDSHDEIDLLSKEFNKMIARLKTTQEQKEQAQKEILTSQQKALDNLKQADRIKDAFLSNTSHELKTPLNGIIGLTESVIHDAKTTLSSEQMRDLQLVVQSGRRLSSLVNDILDYSKIQHQELHINYKTIDLRSAVDLSVKLSKHLIKEKEILLENHVDSQLPLVKADENRLEQILLNLIGNAIKFTREGAVTITAEQLENVICVSVTDTGIGIPPEKQDRIFEYYEQADGSISREYGGTGLGLAITKKLVELQGGVITLESTPDQGSTFSFTLPISDDQTESQNTTKVSDYNAQSMYLDHEVILEKEKEHHDILKRFSKLKGASILVVDDEPINIHVLRNQLQPQGYLVHTANDGFEALEILENLKGKKEFPRLILLDLMMPNMSGFEVARRVRQTYDSATLPIVILTAKNQITDLVDGFAAGANDYLAKPFVQEELLVRITTHMQLSQISHALTESNENLELLLSNMQELNALHDKFSMMVQMVNTILKKITVKPSTKIHIAFQETVLEGELGYASFQAPVVQKDSEGPYIKLDAVHEVEHYFSREIPVSITGQKQQMATGCYFHGTILYVVLGIDGKLQGFIRITEVENEGISEESRDFINILAQYLAIALEEIGTTLNLERIVIKRTKELYRALQEVEQQNTSLSASNRKLSELNSTKEELLRKLNHLSENSLKSLEETLEQGVAKNIPECIRASREAFKIQEILRPILSLFFAEQAVRHKRVLLAENNKKQQIIAKMALRGTGVELDIASNFEMGQQYLESHDYDILCVNADMIPLAKQAVDSNKNVKTLFITSDKASEYLPILKQHPFLSNIVSRSEEDRVFTLKNISTTVQKLASDDFFGLEKYLNWGIEAQQKTITSSENRDRLLETMETFFSQLGIRRPMLDKCIMVAEELIVNAIYDAPVDAEGVPLYNHLPRTTAVHLRPEEQGLFRYACDGMLIGISVEDPFGMFDRETILQYLESCYDNRAGTLQVNKGGAGRGIFQIMETADLVIWNVRPKVRTEVIALFNLEPNKLKGHKTTSFHYFYA